jgi:hypothetical protein
MLASKTKSASPDLVPSFSLSSPSDMKYAMFAAYPIRVPGVMIRTLDFLPDARPEPE